MFSQEILSVIIILENNKIHLQLILHNIGFKYALPCKCCAVFQFLYLVSDLLF